MYSGGYAGKILRINLTDKTSKEEKLPAETARDFIGGAMMRRFIRGRIPS
jgi:aldehyde:ferredoxin oxidoreductase